MDNKLIDNNLRLRTTDVIYLYYAVKNYMQETEYKLAQVKKTSDLGVVLSGHMANGTYLLKKLTERMDSDMLATSKRQDFEYFKKVINDHKRRN